jgi:predicted NBD/HSP70 family sugar kinase
MAPLNPLKQEEEFSEKEKRNLTIIEILRKFGPISRPDISQKMGLNVVTISNYIDDFLKQGLTYEKELDVSEGGRRPALLDLNPQCAYAVGVGLNLMNMVGLLIDLKGNIVLKTQVERPTVSVTEIIKSLLEMISQIIQRSKDYMKNIKGIGIGIAGLVDKKEGSIRWPERVNCNYTNYVSVNFPLRELIEKEFGLPAVIENDATAACFGEQWLQLDLSLKNILFMFSGVGCGIIINGQVYTGSHGCAGEPSIYNYKQDQLFNCALGNPCFLKRWDIDLGIVDDVKAILTKDKEAAEKFFKLTSRSNIDNVDLRSVFMASRAEDEVASKVLDTAAQRLGIKIAYLVNLLNPQMVVIGGGFEEAGEGFLNKVNSTVRDWAFREATEDLKIIYSQLRENAVALGAASLVMQRSLARL